MYPYQKLVISPYNFFSVGKKRNTCIFYMETLTINVEERLGKHSKLSVDKKNQLGVTFLFFISLLIVAQHVSGNHVPIIRS